MSPSPCQGVVVRGIALDVWILRDSAYFSRQGKVQRKTLGCCIWKEPNALCLLAKHALSLTDTGKTSFAVFSRAAHYEEKKKKTSIKWSWLLNIFAQPRHTLNRLRVKVWVRGILEDWWLLRISLQQTSISLCKHELFPWQNSSTGNDFSPPFCPQAPKKKNHKLSAQ